MHTHIQICIYPIKRCSISLIIREMKIRTTLRYHFSPIRLVKIKRYNTFFWPGYYRGGSHFRTLLVECKPVQPFWRGTWQANMNDTCICFWPTIPLLGICPEDIPLLVQNHIATMSLITTLFVIAKYSENLNTCSMASSWINYGTFTQWSTKQL